MNKNYNTHLRSGSLVNLYTCKIKCEPNMSLHESGQFDVERVKVEAGRCEAGEMSPYCGLMEFRWGCKQWSDPVVFCWTLHDLLHSFHLVHANKLAFPGPCRAAPLMLRGTLLLSNPSQQVGLISVVDVVWVGRRRFIMSSVQAACPSTKPLLSQYYTFVFINLEHFSPGIWKFR